MCCCRNKVEPEDEGMDDIETSRSCTDILWIGLFGAFWIGMVAIAATALTTGEPKKLLYAADYEGITCDLEVNAGKKYAVYPRMTEDLWAIAQTGATSYSDFKFYGVCVEKCPNALDWVCDREGDKMFTGVTAAERKKNLDDCLATTVAKGGAFLYNDVGLARKPECRSYFKHCWLVDADLTSIFYRCMPIYNVTKRERTECIFPTSTAASDEKCAKKRVTSTTVTERPAKKNYLYDQLNSFVGTIMRYFGDVQKSAHIIIVCGGLVALLVGLIWLVLMRFFAGCMVWSVLAAVLLLTSAFNVFCYVKAGIIGSSDLEAATGVAMQGDDASPYAAYASVNEKTKEYWKYVAYFGTAVVLLILILIIWMKDKINIAIGIIKETSKAIQRMPMLLAYPIVTLAFLILLIVYWIIVCMYIMSSDSISLNDIRETGGYVPSQDTNYTALNITQSPSPSGVGTNGTKTYTCGDKCNANAMRYIMMYHFFGLLWTNQVLQGIGIMVIAGAVSKWYFAGPHDGDVDDEDKKIHVASRLGRVPVLRSCGRTMRYHFGSICFGAFAIATVQFIRAALAYLDYNTKGWQDKNKLLKCLFKIVQCLLWCFEKCVKYVSKMAYITTAIEGKSFCPAAMASIQLFMRESQLISLINVLSMFIIVISKIVISASAGTVAFMWLEYGLQGDAKVSGAALPVLLTIIFGYFVAEAILDVYVSGIDTILLCFVMDKERNEDSGNRKCGASLQKFIKKNKKKKKKAAGEDDDEDGGNDDDDEAQYDSVGPQSGGGGGGTVSI